MPNHYNDMNATITEVDNNPKRFPLISLEWEGPDDHEVHDFDLSALGEVHAYGRDLLSAHRGWVMLSGECRMSPGQTIPCIKS